MKLQNCLSVFTLFIVLLTACSKTSNKQFDNDKLSKIESNQISGIDTVIDNFTDLSLLRRLLEPEGQFFGEGQEVSLKSANECISFFRPVMWEHGIRDKDNLDNERGPDTMFLRETEKIRMITESVRFTGNNLLGWMLRMADRYNSVRYKPGTKLGIRLKFGIYTENFLNDNVNDKERREKLLGRTTTFIVPYYISEGTNAIVDDENATVYNLGGLEP